MRKEHKNVAIASSTRRKEMIDEAIYATWEKLTTEFPDESENEPLTAQEYCRYIQNMI